jgi:hypothetical protein
MASRTGSRMASRTASPTDIRSRAMRAKLAIHPAALPTSRALR